MIFILSNATRFFELKVFYVRFFFVRFVKPESLPTFFSFWFYIASTRLSLFFIFISGAKELYLFTFGLWLISVRHAMQEYTIPGIYFDFFFWISKNLLRSKSKMLNRPILDKKDTSKKEGRARWVHKY